MIKARGPGLYQKVAGGVWMVRRRVPGDLREKFGFEFKASLGTADIAVACTRRDRWWAERDCDIRLARQAGRSPIADVAEVRRAIQTWREGKTCLASAYAALKELTPAHAVYPPAAQRSPWRLDPELVLRAQLIFLKRPFASRGPGLPADTSALLLRLQAAVGNGQACNAIAGFDAKLDDALAEVGFDALMLPQTRELVRSEFAEAWLQVTQVEELDRRRAVLVLALDEVLQQTSSSILATPEAQGPSARHPGKTLGELIAAARSEKARGRRQIEGLAFVRKNYEHIFRALAELIGESTPISVIGRDEVRRIHDLLQSLPAHATKLYPGRPLEEAAVRARTDARRLMSHNNARSYLSNLSALFNYAIREGWLEKNPCEGLVPPRQDSVRRRGFTAEELTLIFSRLEAERGSDRWWVLAILAFSGARASEVCQLQVADIRQEDGVFYFDFSCFDPDGRRDTSKALKTAFSQRVAPIHPELVSAGLISYLDTRRSTGGKRLFASIRRAPQGGYSHDLSKWFGRFLDRAGLSAAGLVMHSFRHGFREAGRRAALSEEIIDALGGWAPRSVGARYGDRQTIAANAVHIAKISYGGFRLQR